MSISSDYYDKTNNFVNVIGGFYEVRKNNSLLYNGIVNAYLIVYENNELNIEFYAKFFCNYNSEIDETKAMLEKDGFINFREWCEINKKRLIGDEDILTLIKKKIK